jgi:D-alanyl-D-alanine endopeptidase (penicillin-binding protein 7)
LQRTVKLIGAICVVFLGLSGEKLWALQKSTPQKAPAPKSTTQKSATTKQSQSTSKKSVTSSKSTSASVSSAKKTTSSSASRRKRAQARAAAQAKALAEAQQPRFRVDENGVQVPDVRAEAAIIYDPESGAVLWESNSQNQRSIASITKVMTALVFLESDPDLDRTIVVDRSDVRAASTTVLKAGYKLTTKDLLQLTLIASDNAAARALARVSPHGSAGFIDRMNEKARELGLSSTSYVDSSGLLSDNISSAYDMARLIALVSSDERIAGPMRTPHYSFRVGRRTIQVHSTNQLVTRGDVDVQAGKTGFISKAGYCLAALLRLPEGGPQVAVVVLGAKSNAGRFWETRHLFNWLSGNASALAGGQPTPLQAAAASAD